MTNPISEDVKKILADAKVGVFAGGTGWGIYVGYEPKADIESATASIPNTVISIYDTGGFQDPHPRLNIDYPTFQVRVRGERHDYLGGYAKMQEVKDTLLGKGNFDLNDTRYVGIWVIGDITHIGETEERPLFITNFRAIREPAPGDHRSDC